MLQSQPDATMAAAAPPASKIVWHKAVASTLKALIDGDKTSSAVYRYRAQCTASAAAIILLSTSSYRVRPMKKRYYLPDRRTKSHPSALLYLQIERDLQIEREVESGDRDEELRLIRLQRLDHPAGFPHLKFGACLSASDFKVPLQHSTWEGTWKPGISIACRHRITLGPWCSAAKADINEWFSDRFEIGLVVQADYDEHLRTSIDTDQNPIACQCDFCQAPAPIVRVDKRKRKREAAPVYFGPPKRPHKKKPRIRKPKASTVIEPKPVLKLILPFGSVGMLALPGRRKRDRRGGVDVFHVETSPAVVEVVDNSSHGKLDVQPLKSDRDDRDAASVDDHVHDATSIAPSTLTLLFQRYQSIMSRSSPTD